MKNGIHTFCNFEDFNMINSILSDHRFHRCRHRRYHRCRCRNSHRHRCSRRYQHCYHCHYRLPHCQCYRWYYHCCYRRNHCRYCLRSPCFLYCPELRMELRLYLSRNPHYNNSLHHNCSHNYNHHHFRRNAGHSLSLIHI